MKHHSVEFSIRFKMSWLRIFTLFCMLQVISGYCYIQVFDTNYCTAPNGDSIPIGTELEFKDKCEKCSCSANPGETTLHMSCCGYGSHAGVIMPPEGCKLVTGDDGCSVKIVKIADETQLCL